MIDDVRTAKRERVNLAGLRINAPIELVAGGTSRGKSSDVGVFA